ncbi:enoyl-CoA hydratase/isomerase family protein [Halomonas denitrificans]|uniref:enoyl-CoA hydratase/isomerase family protein n=1 Tax=Halomonas denitrificans TaxID=370769 RepID=UPI001C99EDD0|nr:enoyl-CoA hydratase/isomerase family protein [Halomonas denitrificans]MBY5970497.1 enoyl-CoA hydratase/isomerase family protein [Halomonas denitrificans]MEE3214876.1 enoyl-CoA hydratase/isomerase family protein [Pseudomonadota bacterium]
MHQDLVRFQRRPAAGGGCVGIATLNAPKALNALSLEMIEQLDERLEEWAQDPDVHAVWLQGEGDKAFCAGGDVVALVRELQREKTQRVQPGTYATQYFAAEYRLDYRLHTYPKPLLVWADGIVMGGGLGLTAGGRHRLVTETTRIAMPEVTIGLYPDIGASWFLNKMPPGVGLYLGLTGASINARDALDLGMADRFVPRERGDELLDALCDCHFAAGHVVDAEALVCEVLARFESPEQAPAAQVWPHLDHLRSLVGKGRVEDAVAAITADHSDDAWLAANRKRLSQGCPLTAHLAWHMLKRHRHSSLADTFRDELVVSVQCNVLGDFAEGVRALLIDKDKSPQWRHRDVSSVPAADLAAMFGAPWGKAPGPLDDL